MLILLLEEHQHFWTRAQHLTSFLLIATWSPCLPQSLLRHVDYGSTIGIVSEVVQSDKLVIQNPGQAAEGLVKCRALCRAWACLGEEAVIYFQHFCHHAWNHGQVPQWEWESADQHGALPGRAALRGSGLWGRAHMWLLSRLPSFHRKAIWFVFRGWCLKRKVRLAS